MDVIISHGNPDFDSLASMVAASRLYPEAKIVLSGSPDQNVRDFLALHGQRFPIVPLKELPKEKVARLIVVDTRQGERLAGFREFLNDPKVEIHVYDHHPVLYNDLTGDYSVSERVGACTTMMVRLLRERELPITPLEATLYALGIYGDTGSLTFVSTTAEDVEAAAWLLRRGASLEMMAAFVSHSLSEAQRILLKFLLENSSHYAIQGADVVIARAETEHYVEELAFLAQKFMDLERPDCVFVLVKMRDRLCIVGRSRVPAIDVGMILTSLGGGGHSTAASCVLKGRKLVDMERILLDNLKKKIRSPVLAADIMSHPVRTVPSSATITEAVKEMARYGHNALVVCDEGRVTGIISRRDLDKAVRHGYSSEQVHTCMSTNLITASPDTPVPEIQHMMLARGIGRIPVLKNDNLIGIITRTDLLHALKRQAFQPPQVSPSPRIEDLGSLPKPLQALLRRIGELADQLEITIFAVGGFVRDLLLGVENLDLDVVVEGDGIFFAEKLASLVDGKLRSHHQFGTAIIFLPDGQKIDVASARAEFYARPAAMPEVASSSIKQDLYRRDFTVNAMALKLNSKDFGQLVDFFGGLRDLQHGVIRVLHNLSFIEDPTRAFRAVRFEQRYHFRMEGHTESLLRQAIHENIFEKVAFERIRDEMILLLSEEYPLPALQRLHKLKLLRVIHPDLKLDQRQIEILEGVQKAGKEYDGILKKYNLKLWLLYCLALLAFLSRESAEQVCRRFRFSKTIMNRLVLPEEGIRKMISALSAKDATVGGLVDRLHDLSDEVVFFVMSQVRNPKVRENLEEYMTTLRKLRGYLTGKDLKAMGVQPGPVYRQLLHKALLAQLDGEIAGHEEAIQFASRELGRRGQG